MLYDIIYSRWRKSIYERETTIMDSGYNLKKQKCLKWDLPCYKKSEDILNTISHSIGVAFAVLALCALAKKYAHSINLVWTMIYSISLIVLYGISSIYHGLKPGKIKAIFRKLDHCSIFLLIAGTYTPLCAIFIKTQISMIVLSGVWLFAIIGIVLNSISVNKFSKISLFLYIMMGWSIVLIFPSAMKCLTLFQIKWLLIGGIFYTVGAVFYVIGKKCSYIHFVWHLFVLSGSICHYIII